MVISNFAQMLKAFTLAKRRRYFESNSTSAPEKSPPPTTVAAATLPPPPPKNESYVLKRDYQGSSRLNLQFFLWKSALQFNLHPDIPAPKASARIADVAMGTGIWLIDLAQSLPSTVQFDGFDISLVQAPAQKRLPSNIKIHKWDMFIDPPAELVGQYDIVHVRLITLVIKDNNALPVIKNLRKLLRPNGYLQWDEIDTVGGYIDTIDSSLSAPALDSLYKSFAIPKSAQVRDEWKSSLTTTLNQNGFQDSKLYTYKYDISMARYWHDMYMQTWEEFALQIFGSTENANEKIDQAVLEAQRQSGAAAIFPKFVWVAKAA